MSQKPNTNSDPRSESDRLCQDNEAIASKYNDLIASSSSKQTHHHHHHHHHNYMNNEIPKEETKSHRIRNSNFHSLSQHSQLNLSQEMQSNSNNNNSNSNNNISNNITNLNQRYGQNNMTRSTTSPLLYQYPPFQHPVPALSSKSTLKSENLTRHSVKQKASPSLSSSSSTTINNMMGFSQSSSALSRDDYRSVHNSRQDQQDRETNEVVTMIREELEDGFKEAELETLGSLERNLPVELSFLIRQQAYCMARMNYLDRQIRELKDVRQTNVPPQQQQANSTSTNQSHRNSNNIATSTIAANNTATTTTHTKNGNFIPSDDSGGEYSRATISDDDELSSLLDQIAKSVRPERNVNPNVRTNHPRANYSNIASNQPQPQYAIINPALHHQQAVPVFVMGSPIALAHPSSISSNVLPGVHFQPEARYNQYYEEFYAPNNNNNNNNSSATTLHRSTGGGGGGIRLQQFDNSISAIEQLVSQKEKRQITSQLKSADNWLKMRSSGLSNLNSNYSNTNNRTTSNGDGTGSASDRNPVASSAPDNNSSNSVIEENRGR